MGKKKAPTGLGSKPAHNQAKQRHFKDGRDRQEKRLAPLPVPLIAKKPLGVISYKYPTYFELVTNSDKKKKLEIQDTDDVNPQPGFAFLRSGDPVLTEKCKEISRERGFLMFRVLDKTGMRDATLSAMGRHINRVGYHVRETVLDEARQSVGSGVSLGKEVPAGAPEPIPEKQEEIDAQADAAIRDLFPRIPHIDRQQIIDRSFNKARHNNGARVVPVGLAKDLLLTRRVHLAVLAHIRHDLTQYDLYLRMGMNRVDARKHVQPVCLDYLVKWRGDEETGRDQLDEILREVIVINDEEDDDDSSDDSTESSVDAGSRSGSARRGERQISRRDQGYEGYEAARDRAWQQAVDRQRGQLVTPVDPLPPVADVPNNHQTHPLPRPPPPPLPVHFSNGYRSLSRHTIHAPSRDPAFADRSVWTSSPDATGQSWYYDNQPAPQPSYHPWQSHHHQASYPSETYYPTPIYYPPQTYYPPQASYQTRQPPRFPGNPPTTQPEVIDLTDDGYMSRRVIDLTGDDYFEPSATMIPVRNKFPQRFESLPPAEQYRVRPVHGIPRAKEQDQSGGFEQFLHERVTRQERVLGIFEGPAPQPESFPQDRALDPFRHEQVLGLASHPAHGGGPHPVRLAPFRQERVLGYEYGYRD